MSKSRGQNSNLADFTPTKYQDEFLRGDKRYLGFVSGVGAGKTYAGIIRTFLNMEAWNPGEMGAIVAPTRQMIVNVIIPEMRDLGLLNKWEYNSTYSDEPGIHSPNGSRALILSADNEKTVERLRGLNLAWGWIDERTEVPDRAKEILSQRLRTGNYRNLYETTTPSGKDSTYEFYVRDVDAEERSFGQATVYEAENQLAIVGVPTRANPNTPEDYKEDMDNLPEQIHAQEVQGRFVEIGSGVFKRDMISFVTPDQLPDRDFHYCMSVDVGVEADSQKAKDNDSDYWAVSLGAVDSISKQGYLLDCHRKRGMTLKQGVEWISRIAPKGNPRVFVESNQSQRWLKQELKDQGLNAQAVMNTSNKEERIIQLTLPLERGDIKFINREIDPQLGYDPRFKDLISEMLSFPEGSHDDLVDSLEILVDNMDIGQTSTILGADPHGDT